MGGYNSGKRSTSDMHALDIRKIARAGLLEPGNSFGWQWTCNGEKIASISMRAETARVMLDYRSRERGSEWEDMHYPVYLAWTRCNYGGERVWWICPVTGCERRVAVLFGGKVYGCRHCHRLAYQTQREQPHDRAASRADTIRKRLQWDAGILNLPGGKPKGMHWRTFQRLQSAHDAYASQALTGMTARFEAMPKIIWG